MASSSKVERGSPAVGLHLDVNLILEVPWFTWVCLGYSVGPFNVETLINQFGNFASVTISYLLSLFQNSSVIDLPRVTNPKICLFSLSVLIFGCFFSETFQPFYF